MLNRLITMSFNLKVPQYWLNHHVCVSMNDEIPQVLTMQRFKYSQLREYVRLFMD